MKDAYSFCQDKAQMRKVYEEMQIAYERIFSRCGLRYKLVEAESGPIGGDVSHEFIATASCGEDRIVECEQCGYSAKLERAGSEIKIEENDVRSILSGEKCPICEASLRITKGIEIGHLFQLGEHYSEVLEASFLDQEGKLHPLLMGCYGIGISRLPAVVIEQNNDRDGIIWPKEVAPFSAVIISTNEQVFDFSEKIYLELKESSMDILWDDRAISAGIKFKDSDLIGIPLKVIIGNAFLREEKIEIKKRSTGEVIKVGKAQLLQKLRELI
jgi:prolyl-tRNA synthetase